ncbi:DUF433 domain-containing protein [Arhodomonas sp. AD133]|uniref:DUF433 domain-containing protein n=1 Tax=Arhodomonas sp. AD133 TaxID=3415009 RepID=UPI003EBE9208
MAELIGHGIYSIPEAARLAGIAPTKVRRWVFGFTAKQQNGSRAHYAGLWDPEYRDEDEHALSFRDLLEVRFVHAFRKHGVSLQAIRQAASHARELLDTKYPFTCRQFRTDGRSVFAAVAPEVSDYEDRERLLDLAKRQYVFREVISPSLYAGIEYDQTGDAERWYPLPETRAIVLDPQRAFGKPILDDYRVPTEALAAAVKVEGDTTIVARLYEIPEDQVRMAVKFEQGMAQRASAH